MATVLVVDDSPVDRRLAGKLLEKNSQLAVDYAAHGGDALRQMEQRMPDLVLTDLQMPSMDGLRLVETIRRLYPLVPVIIMTAHGSEDVAVKALMSGAAGFVPKGGLAGALVDTVESVLTLARKKRGHDRLMDCVSSGEANLALPGDRSLFAPFVEHVQHLVSAIGLVDETGSLRVALAMEEALVNALYHGNLRLSAGRDRSRRTQHVSSIGPGRVARSIVARSPRAEDLRASGVLARAGGLHHPRRGPGLRSGQHSAVARRIRSISAARARPAGGWC